MSKVKPMTKHAFAAGVLLVIVLQIIPPSASNAQVLTQPSSTSRPSERPNQVHPDLEGEKQARHPLDPLDSDEISIATNTVRKVRELGDSFRFVSVALKEPSKE